MIELKVSPYCHDCMAFEPTCDKTEIYSEDDDCFVVNIEIKCKHTGVCRRIERHLKRVQEEKLENEKDPEEGTPWSDEIMSRYR